MYKTPLKKQIEKKLFKISTIIVLTLLAILVIALLVNTSIKTVEPAKASFYKIENASNQEAIKNSGGQHFQSMPLLRGATKIDRILDLAKANNSPLDEYGVRNSYIVSEMLGINASVPFCIAQADSQMGSKGKAKRTKNPCNVGNTDGGETKVFPTYKDGMEACVRLLDRKQYKKTDLLGELSNGGRALLGLPMDNGSWSKGDKVWATSKENHIINMIRCVREVEQDNTIDHAFKFKN